jgi:hypothetical protein
MGINPGVAPTKSISINTNGVVWLGAPSTLEKAQAGMIRSRELGLPFVRPRHGTELADVAGQRAPMVGAELGEPLSAPKSVC